MRHLLNQCEEGIKMKKWMTILASLFAFQLVLMIAVNVSGDDYAAFKADEKLLSTNLDSVNRVQIENDTQRVILEKQNGQWVLPEKWNYPADAPTLTQLLDTISSLDKGWPVATTPSAAERFNVAENDFERKITLLTGDELQATLYIGTSPGFRKTHVRLDGDDHIYAVALESWKASVQDDDWLKKDILSFDATDVNKLVMADFVLTRSDKILQLEDLAEQESPDENAISSLVSSLANLQIQSVSGLESEEGNQSNSTDHEIGLTFKNGEELSYRFYKPETTEDENSYYMLNRSDLPYYFTVAEFTVKPLLEAERSRLIQENEDEVESEKAEEN